MIERKILFVCTGNTCRSPMAAALLSAALAAQPASAHAKYTVASAGIMVARPGEPASSQAVAAMAERGISLAEHQARQLDDRLIAGADLILTMTRAHTARLADDYPGARDKLFTLAAYIGLDTGGCDRASRLAGDVPDPFGGTLADYRNSAAGLAGMIQKLVALIQSEEEFALTQIASPCEASAVTGSALADVPVGATVAPLPGLAGRTVARLAVGADHAGYALKDQLAAAVATLGIEIEDVGTNGPGSVDYPDYAARVGEAVANGRCQAGLLVCGTGLGMAIAANKVAGVRAVTCNDLYSARLSREHNDANVLCLGARVIAYELAREIVLSFLQTPFGGGRHVMRVSKIADLEGTSSQDLLGKGW
jgi:ribose 5-phosphate isomerase B